ncbi:MAG: DUF2723 domain-containing protein [Gemmatimonadaceae bacterium]
MNRAASYHKETKIYLIVATIVIFVVGYGDLARGGTTVSAFALAIGYCVMIPLTIWRGGGPRTRTSSDSGRDPSYGAAAIAGLVVLALYIVTMAPSTAMWDTSEYITAAYVFGIPHPPGNPFFVIVGRVFALLPIAGNVAARINVLAAICSAASAAFWFLVTEHVLARWIASRRVRVAGATCAALLGATAFTVWTQSVVNEKVYTVSLVGIALVSWLAVRWSEEQEGARADRLLIMMAYLCGLGYANHMAGMLPAPAIAVLVLVLRPATVLRARLLAVCVVALGLGVSPFATQPIRAAYFPALSEGEPTACRTEISWSCTFSKGTLEAFSYNFNRVQYGKPDLSDRQASLSDQIGMWWMYFKWQWIRDASSAHPFAQALLAATFLVLGVIGAWTHASRDRQSFWYFGTLMFTMTLLLIYYLNFKLGWSQDQSSSAPHEVRDRDYFYLWSYSAWSVWAALGLTFVWESIASIVAARKDGISLNEAIPALAWRSASPALLLALIPLGANWSSASRAGHRSTRNIAVDLLNSVEPYGVLVTVGDNDTFPLWYAQEVEGIRRDVVVACTSLLNTDWYVRQIIRRPVYPYDAANGPSIYRDQRWTKPASGPLHLSLDEADAIPQYYQLPQPMDFVAGGIRATIDAKNLEYGVLQRADIIVLDMIRDAWPERPIYFARSAGSYPRALGLENNVLAQGLASKLFIPPATQSSLKDTVIVQGDGWFDIARTNTLWRDTFGGPASVIREGKWVDRASVSMPYLYVMTGAELSDVLRSSGRVTEADQVAVTVKSIAGATGLDAVVRQLDQSLPRQLGGDSAGVSLRAKNDEVPKTRSTEPIRKPKP